ncbi:hypothetical protein EUX98_g7517 [Antrodiella citrinella]|uniref:DUF218 domain-containing protein n=1 Tax=Antrodiella citrinella TaxID=2447956 RepID=A0A4S4MLW8_9APHY|nr:hypothetical protein EUX98_g7517 [Antrodiella citrinella]
MLPTPASFRIGQRSKGHLVNLHHRSKLDILLTRARVTNLGFLILAAFAVLSFLVNLSYYFSEPSGGSIAKALDAFGHAPDSILATIHRDDALKGLNHLIVVPGHGIWKGWSKDQALAEDKWILEQYQQGGGRVQAWVSHIETGAELARVDENALVVFSGGQTRQNSTTTEAESYLRLASQTGTFGAQPGLFRRATTEDHALDSFQNLLFSIARFHEYTGSYPELITVVGYEMKRRRFTELHRAALRWPAERFHYIGIDPDKEVPAARDGERQNGYLPYTLDTYGCHDMLQSKRRSRNPFFRYHSYYTSSPELGGLFNWCPGPREGGHTVLYPGPLPWYTPPR